MSDKYQDMFNRMIELSGQHPECFRLNTEALRRLKAEIMKGTPPVQDPTVSEAVARLKKKGEASRVKACKGLTAEDLEYLSFLGKGE